jgi:hypothetical protein
MTVGVTGMCRIRRDGRANGPVLPGTAFLPRTAILPPLLLVLCLLPTSLLAQRGNRLFPAPVAPVAETEDFLTAARVRESIDRGINYLKRSQDNGTWPEFGTFHKGGVTALVTLALLNTGVSPDDTTIRLSLAALDRVNVKGSSVYTVSLMTMVYCYAAPDTKRARIRECADFLIEAQYRNNSSSSGGWSYRVHDNRPDASNTQFALLALHDAAIAGIEVPTEVWTSSRRYWERMRDLRNGGFAYSSELSSASGSMSCAAISSLIIIDENLPQSVPVANGRIQCCQGEDRLELVEGASQWLASNFSIKINPPRNQTFQNDWLYYLYGMERAARLSGVRFFGTHDWYREGAAHLVRVQTTNGSWLGYSSHGESDPNIATAYALLFLSKGKRPIVIGKYKHSDDNDWDRHRQGVHFLTRRLERDWKANLNWQTIEGSVATADDLLETPVLFISGRDELRLNENQKKALREYVEYGGFIFAEACQGDGCGENVPFDRSFRELMVELFPGSQLQLLDQNHPVYAAQYMLGNPNPDRPLYGLQSSCRTSVIYCPRNLAGFWKHNRPASLNLLAPGPKKEVEYCIQLGANVIAYATGREVKDKLDRPLATSDNDMGLGSRTVLIPKLAHGGGDDDAPNAWQNMVRSAQFDLGERFRVERRVVSPTEEQLSEFPMVFMHGRAGYVWNNDERLALREYLTHRSGFLFADSICSGSGFADSFRNEMRQIIPDASLQLIPPGDPIWSKQLGGYDLAEVGMHRRGINGTVDYYRTAPQLEGIQIDGRWVVIFSPNDLSCAMENASPFQCPGYDKDDAARIGVNVILYALKKL